jgi:hypothetical protein
VICNTLIICDVFSFILSLFFKQNNGKRNERENGEEKCMMYKGGGGKTFPGGVQKWLVSVIANCEARSRKQSGILELTGLLRRFTPRNDGDMRRVTSEGAA